MSAPPTSSPLTKSCGIVGQFDSAESCWRMRGSGRMSTAANGVPSASSAATVRAEKPQRGASGVPFMKRMTSLPEIAFWISSLICCSTVLMETLLRSRDEGQGVDGAADVGPEDRVDAAVLLDPAELRELRRGDRGPEVIPGAVQVDHIGDGARDGRLDALLQLVGRRHS